MKREAMLRRATERTEPWDFAIIGGGATGIGVAVDAASRGYSVLLVEQSDFGKGTSSRSTKLVHGGVRYLQQGNIPLVMEALRERGRLRRNAPHLVQDLEFVVPNYVWWEAPFYGIGMKVYDALAGKYGFGKSRNLSKEETVERLPTIETEGLRGGVVYHDGQFDDARLLLDLGQTAAGQGATLVNYCAAVGLEKDRDGFLTGLSAVDQETDAGLQVKARVVVNATGVFTDEIRRMDEPGASPMIKPSQGVHIVLPRDFLGGDSAIMVPHTDDGRVLFAIPWHTVVIVGTTDTPVSETPLEPVPFEEEVEFLLTHAARYLTKDPIRSDVLSCFAGLRPLVSQGEDGDTASISRDHTLHVSSSGLLTLTGGKWTTYRKMAEDAVDHGIVLGGLEPQECVTEDLNIHGFHTHPERFGELAAYGSDAPAVESLIRSDPDLSKPIHPRLRATSGEILWAVREEMARTVEDVLARRTRSLILDARAAAEAAPAVAKLMASELRRNRSWIKGQIRDFTELAGFYFLD
ncbi:MAG: glycerol-3-phosphate dehydrogenase/oxidase [Gemmatimonadetes bacterium]|nr:glycerol-3-phosphate dehydrogenase/oxidase [Gemmatimonadota bacterium]NNM07112.1 glycerol-3-phosphate dehydrogenase/oxidase [Gemmatimonadota bacterium]